MLIQKVEEKTVWHPDDFEPLTPNDANPYLLGAAIRLGSLLGTSTETP
jgi:hypothetical protein